MPTVYQGKFTERDWYQVTKNGNHFSAIPSQKLYNHSPDGFAWGYGGSGPAQLALALLFDVLGVSEEALKYYQAFKREVVSHWDKDSFSITNVDIVEWVLDTQDTQSC